MDQDNDDDGGTPTPGQPSEWQRSLNEIANTWTKALRPTFDEVNRVAASIRRATDTTHQLLADVSRQIAAVPNVKQLAWSQAVMELVETLKASLPPNWDGQPIGEIVQIMSETGLALAWVPRRSVLEEILAADTHARRFEILLEREDEILDDVTECLNDVKSSELAGLRAMAMESLATFQDGHDSGAQALAAATLTDALESTLEIQLGPLRSEFAGRDPQQASITYFRLVATLVAVARETLSQFNRKRGDPIPNRFNRHASLHTVSPVQYTRRNAIMSLMLLASILREFDSHS